MAGSKVETTIAYKLDARGLREAKRELEKSFKPETVKALNAALKDARSRVKDLSLEYSRAAKAQGAMANAPKALRANLKAARDEVSKLTDDLKRQADAEKQLLAIHQKQAQLARENRGTAFRQGAYQGFGGAMASYMQRREQATTEEQRAELRAQFMGQLAGGAARRVVGGVRAGIGMASGMVGGQGPLSSVLGGVPFLGGAAQLAEGAVGSFVQRQQALLGAMPYGGADVVRAARAGRPGTKAIPAVYDLPHDVLESPGARAARVQEKVQAALKSVGLESTEDVDREGNVFRRESEEARIVRLSVEERERASELKKMGGVLRPGTGVGATPATKGTAAKRVTDLMADAVHGLITDTEAIQAGTAFTKQVGGRFDRGAKEGQGHFAQAFAAETIHGVDQSTSAGLFRAQRAGRGGTSRDPVNMLAKAIGAATAQGLEGSEIGEYLDTIASAQADAASKGLSLETETLTELATALARGGMLGPQAGRVAGSITAAAQGVVTQGARGPIDIQMLRAAGFDPAKGNFLETRRKLAGGMDAGSVFDLLQSLAGEGRDEERSYALERAGLGLGMPQADAAVEMLKGGKEAFMASMAGAGTGSVEELLAGMRMVDQKTGKATTLGQITGAVRGQVAVQNQLTAAGGAAAANVQQLQQQAAAMATTMATSLKPFMDPLTKNIVSVSKGIESLMVMLGEWGKSGDGIPVKVIGGI